MAIETDPTRTGDTEPTDDTTRSQNFQGVVEQSREHGLSLVDLLTPQQLATLLSLISAGTALLTIVSNPVGFVTGALRSEFGETVLSLLSEPVVFIEGVIRTFILKELVLPFIAGILGAFNFAQSLVILFFVGSNAAVGLEPGGTAGVFDVPDYIFQVIGGVATPGQLFIFGLIESYGTFILGVAEPLGPLAPVVVLPTVALTGGALLWAAWAIIINVDLPLISLEGILRTLSAPFRFVLRVAGIR